MSERSRRQQGRGWWLALVAGLLAIPASAHAHASVEGMGKFSAGLIHPLLTPSHLLILLGLGLWLGQHRPLQLRAPMLLFAPFSAAGLLMAGQLAIPEAWQLLLICLALGIAMLVVLSARLPAWAAQPLFAAAALAIGLDSGLDGSASVTTTAITLVATWLSLNLCIVNFAFYTSICPEHKWVQIGIRVAGSWMAAICLLLLAFSLKGKFLA